MDREAQQELDWGHPPVIATVARLLCPSAMEIQLTTPSRWGSRSRGWPARHSLHAAVEQPPYQQARAEPTPDPCRTSWARQSSSVPCALPSHAR